MGLNVLTRVLDRSIVFETATAACRYKFFFFFFTGKKSYLPRPVVVYGRRGIFDCPKTCSRDAQISASNETMLP